MPIVSNNASGNDIEVNAGETVFDGLDSRGESLAAGCLAGSCSVCKILVLTGADNLDVPGVIEADTIKSIHTNYKGEMNLSEGTVRLACRAKVNGDITFKPLG